MELYPADPVFKEVFRERIEPGIARALKICPKATLRGQFYESNAHFKYELRLTGRKKVNSGACRIWVNTRCCDYGNRKLVETNNDY